MHAPTPLQNKLLKFEISVMLILIFIVSLYNSRISNLLKIKIDDAVNSLDEKIEQFMDDTETFVTESNLDNNKLEESEEEVIDRKCLSQYEIIYSNKPYGKIENSNNIGLDSYELENTEEPREFEYLE